MLLSSLSMAQRRMQLIGHHIGKGYIRYKNYCVEHCIAVAIFISFSVLYIHSL